MVLDPLRPVANPHWSSDGCDYHPHCLSCPLPQCRYDIKGGVRALLNAARNQKIREMRKAGKYIHEIAEELKMGERTVNTILGGSK